MICIIALVVFGVLGLFSVRYRKVAKEALDCVLRRVTLRKCTTGLDKRLKSQITGKLMKRSPKTASFVYKHFEILSWVFTLLLVSSLVATGYGLYNYAVFGNCNGDQGGFCVYDVFGGKDNEFAACGVPGHEGELNPPNVSGHPFFGPATAPVTIIEFGCFACPYTRDAQPALEEVLAEYPEEVKFYFIDFPLPSHPGSEHLAVAAECARQQDTFWRYYARLFKLDLPVEDEELVHLAQQLGMDGNKFLNCLDTNASLEHVYKDIALGNQVGIYGTPTFFINNHTRVGPLSFKEFSNIIERELAKV